MKRLWSVGFVLALVSAGALAQFGPRGGGQHGPGPGGPGGPPPFGPGGPHGEPTDDPAVVVERHIAHFERVATRASTRMHILASATVTAIDALQAHGNDDAATALATARITRITNIAARSTDAIDRALEHALDRLAELEAEDALINEVTDAATTKQALIDENRDTEIERIQAAIAD